MIRLNISIFAAMAAAFTMAAQQAPVNTGMLEAPAEGLPTVIKHKHKAPSASLTADFSIAGAGSSGAVYSENFDSGKGQWTTEATTNVTWAVKKVRGGSATLDFNLIDPDDVSSLYVEGPYQVFKREKSSATSPVIALPSNASLSFYVGFSKNYDDQCVLFLSTVEGEVETPLWNSNDAPGGKPWEWRKIEIDLASLAGKDVAFRFTYGPGTSDTFGTGGYMGDFAIDAFKVQGPATVEHLDVMTGEAITLVNTTTGGDCSSVKWTMPGAVPSTSTEESPVIYYTTDGTYDITLEVTDAQGGTSTKTRTAFVTVTGVAPVAKIGLPATFHLSSTRKPLLSPMTPITFKDASTGFPESWDWTFTGVDPTPNVAYSTNDDCPTVGYSFLHDQLVGLTVSNSHGTSTTTAEVSVEYSGVVNNLQPDDVPANFDMEDWGVFPGSNTVKITAYAEKFSAPSVPIVVDGAYVYFNRNYTSALTDQIADIGVHLYTSVNGLPGEKLDSWWWRTFELDMPSGNQMVGTAFQFTDAPVIDDEFFIVVDGIPAYNDSCCVTFAMAGFRDNGNTAYMLKDGKWMTVPEYFGADKHTSYMIYPSICHSVMSPLPVGDKGVKEVGAAAGTVDFDIFSIRGYNTPVVDAPWMQVVSEPNEMTVDTITVEYDALPAGINGREGHITLTDGATQMTLTVIQKGDSAGVDNVEADTSAPVEYYNLQGIKVEKPANGLYIRRQGAISTKVIL